MKLELKHIAPYLPYKLRWYREGFPIVIQKDFNTEVDYHNKVRRGFRLMLRPLSDLTKEIEHDGERFVPLEKLYELSDYQEYMSDIEEDVYERNTPKRWPYELVEKLFEWHFDVFGLIEAGLAIGLNETT